MGFKARQFFFLSLTITLAFIELAPLAKAQAVVVSEYYNDNPPQEWTEILVIQDNIDLRGWVVTDNNATQTARQGGVRFRNIPYWQHVRAGTIIGIWHRDYLSTNAQDFDTSMADGRVMLAKNDPRFFEPYAAPDVQFPDAPMNLAQEGDIMEVLDANGNHIHGLGHRATPGSYWITMPEPKLNTASACNNGQSNRVFPGSSLIQYNGPHGAPFSEVCAVNITRTLPNRSCTSSASNWEFWHSLRRPDWSNPRLVVTVNATNVQLSWNPVIDPYPNDGMQGYLLVRDSSGQGFIPEQGRIYRDGERIGSTVIVAHLPSTATTFIDPIQLTCGVTYTYRLFAFRFGQDDEYGAYPPPQSTRGRQYNTASFASATAIKLVEQGPTIRTDGSPTTFCEGGGITLSIQNIPSGYTAQWLRNGGVIAGATSATYRATTSGEYRIRLQRPDGCFVLSDSVIIVVHPAPTAVIFPSSRVLLCEDSSQVLQTQLVDTWRYQWYRNGTPILGATSSSYRAATEGAYAVEVINEFGCRALSNPVSIDIVRLRVSTPQQSITFAPLSGCESVREVSVTLENQSSFAIDLTRAIEPPNFFIASPAFPSQLKPGESLTVILRFAPITTGSWRDSIGIHVEPCGRRIWFYVSGTKTGTAGTLVSQSSIVDFGTLTRCQGNVTPKRDSITIRASGDVTVESIRLATPFRLAVPLGTPFTLRDNQTITIPIDFAPLLDRSYGGDLTIRFTSAQCQDSLKIPLRGTLTTPYVGISAREIVFPPLDSCTTIFYDTTVTLYNTSLVPLQVDQLSDEQIQIVHPVPTPTITIPPRDSVVIRLRFSPAGYTATEQRLAITFSGSPCIQSELLVIRGKRYGSRFSINQDTIVLPALYRCKDTSIIGQLVTLSVSTIPQGEVSTALSTVSTSAPWLSTSLTSGPISDGIYPINVYVNPKLLPLGWSSGTVSIRTEPCNRVLTITILAHLDDVELTFLESNKDTVVVDVGNLKVGSQATRHVTLNNSSNATVKFDELSVIPSWLTLDAPFLTTGLPPSTSQSIRLTVTIEQEGEFSYPLILKSASPCIRQLVVIIRGRGIRDTAVSAPISLRIFVPESITASPGQRVRFSIHCDGVTRLLQLDTMIVPMLFDRTLFYPTQVTAGQALEQGIVHGIPTTNGYNIVFTNAQMSRSGIVAYLEGQVLLGNTRRTFILPDKANIQSTDSLVRVATTQPGFLELADDCNIQERLVHLGEGPLFVVATNSSSTISVTLNHISSTEAFIGIYDISGRLLLTLQAGYLTKGKYVYTLPSEAIPNGPLFAIYRAEGRILTVLFSK
ncbi:MAG: hypothetical protein NZ481_00010 [Candidatus Kapabacteria bacterium]|nr:hypothetical protein [Candidatus Kapabacteria bacterium]